MRSALYWLAMIFALGVALLFFAWPEDPVNHSANAPTASA